MKRFVSICALALVVLPFQAWISIAFSAQALENRSQASKAVPEKLLYEIYFRRIAYFADLANKQDQGDLSRIRMKAAIMEELAINDDQNTILSQISSQALEDAALLDEQAKYIISRERARYPAGEIKDGDQVPEVPAELISLQQARDAIFINAKSYLLNQMGSAVFDEIDSRIKSIILPNLKVINSE